MKKDEEMGKVLPFGVFDTVVLLVFTLILNRFFGLVVANAYGVGAARSHWYITSVATLCVIVLATTIFKCDLYRLSRWKGNVREIVASILFVTIVQSVFAVKLNVSSGLFYRFDAVQFIFICIFGPFLEEILFRAIALRSLSLCWNRWGGVCLVSIIAATGHNWFWTAIVIQLMLSVIYVVTEYSIIVSLVAHCAVNAFAFSPLPEALCKFAGGDIQFIPHL